MGSGAPVVQKIRRNSLYWRGRLLSPPFPWALGSALTHAETHTVPAETPTNIPIPFSLPQQGLVLWGTNPRSWGPTAATTA